MAWYGVVSGAIDSLAPFNVTGLIFGPHGIGEHRIYIRMMLNLKTLLT